jgi:hypothetical protein
MNHYRPGGRMPYRTPNPFGGYNYSGGGYTTPNPFGGSTYYPR